jgi:hypothetical protein
MATLVQRMFGAAMLSPATYEEVEHDRGATPQAALVVILAALAAAVGASGHGDEAVVREVLRALLQWLAWSAITYVIGTRVFHGTATPGEVLRTIGFAQTPGIFMALAGLPFLGGLIALVVGLWTLVAVVIATRQALDVDTGRAVLTALLGLAVVIGIMVALAVVAAVIVGVIAAVFGVFAFW